MPDSLSQRIEYLEQHRGLSVSALSAVNLALSDPNLSKLQCQDLLAMWQQKLNSLSEIRLKSLDTPESLPQPGLPPTG